MLAVSTSWRSGEIDHGADLLRAMERLKISHLELEYRITASMFQQLSKLLKTTGMQVVSVHNFFPLPPMVPRGMASGDLFLLSHPDKEERLRAIQWTVRSIECANDLEAGALVLHCGRIDMDPQMEVLFNHLENGSIDSEPAQHFIRAKLAEREQKKPKHVDALRFSLDRLAREAEKRDVLLGLENRYFYHELPGPEDFGPVFSEFAGSPLRYWHDVGHAQVNQALTITSQELLLKTNTDRLLGIHLHDAKGREDHLAPGQGMVDFQTIKALLKEDIIRVLELRPGTLEQEIIEGIDYLRDQRLA